ncbi:protein phosphatase 2C domain-containing protein [Aeromonas fluvialis]|uniref:protein phosphatase 2C domain-containing protein n=1 Tax=Aeromonas fluvialis TaxID=591962 RepID=UPI0005AA8D18|nr:protein phosphatase 2C domain-containing protein [Aeromonas fluvialis]
MTNVADLPQATRLVTPYFDILITSPTGASHLDKGLPCQDASMAGQYFYRGQSYTVAAVADGHGSEKYTQSHVGAFLALQAFQSAVSSLMRVVIETKAESGDWKSYIRNEITLHNFTKSLHSRWIEAVTEHANALLNHSSNDEPSVTPYGTTLAFCFAIDDLIVHGCLGDSAIFQVSDSQATELFPLKPEDSLGLGTDSLSDPRSSKKFRYEIQDKSSVGLLEPTFKNGLWVLTTDGITDSLKSPEKTLSSILEAIKTMGMEKVSQILPSKLSQWSDQGVGDDMACIVIYQKYPEHKTQLRGQTSDTQ